MGIVENNMELRDIIIERIDEMKKINGSYFDKRTWFGKSLNKYDVEHLENRTLVEVFEQMTKIHYTQR